jgi:hypothetical protein
MAEQKKVASKKAAAPAKNRPSNVWAASENVLEVNGEDFYSCTVFFF